MDSPLEKFIEWYMILPVQHRNSIVEFVIFFNIGFDDIDTKNMEKLHNALTATACGNPSALWFSPGLTPPEWEISIIDENLGTSNYPAMPRPDLGALSER
ncbi:hypothetical protein ACFL9T_22610 [Thermodesulfobacteriota bacterium]